MSAAAVSVDRVHVLFHANPPGKDIARFEFDDANAYLRAIRAALPKSLRLTCDRTLLRAVEDQQKGGRTDDARRVRDLQNALHDPRTGWIVAAGGGGYFSRLLPHLDFRALDRRRAPLHAMGFSEITSLVNLIAFSRGGRGTYWLCPNYLAWKIKPAPAAREAFASFWRTLPNLRATGELRAQLVAGKRPSSGAVRLVGGCLSVLAATIVGSVGRRISPAGRWLIIEDVNEAPYRIDRYLATLKIAGWFEKIRGILLGDFHATNAPDQTDAVVALLRYHIPRALPVLATRDFGHVWPMVGLPLNRPLRMRVRGSETTIAAIPALA